MFRSQQRPKEARKRRRAERVTSARALNSENEGDAEYKDALTKSMECKGEGRTRVVDIDLEKFFDRVNHDIRMAMLAKEIKDKRVLLLLQRCLQSGIMVDGIPRERELIGLGLDRHTAWKSANNGHGAWWNIGAKQMNFAFTRNTSAPLSLLLCSI
jgi:hypothetical protein